MNKKHRLVALQIRATEIYGSDDLEIDELKSAHISEGSDGIWVRAWVLVANSDLKEAGIHNPQAYPEEDN